VIDLNKYIFFLENCIDVPQTKNIKMLHVIDIKKIRDQVSDDEIRKFAKGYLYAKKELDLTYVIVHETKIPKSIFSYVESEIYYPKNLYFNPEDQYFYYFAYDFSRSTDKSKIDNIEIEERNKNDNHIENEEDDFSFADFFNFISEILNKPNKQNQHRYRRNCYFEKALDDVILSDQSEKMSKAVDELILKSLIEKMAKALDDLILRKKY